MADDPAQPDRLAAAEAELYQAAPEGFTVRRGELVAAAREAGDREAAQAIGALRRPTRAAWLVNQLSRDEPGAAAELAGLAREMREAQQGRDGRRLRELSAARDALVDRLTARALERGGGDSSAGGPPSPGLQLEVAQTLTAAFADPGVAAEFAAGRLTRAAQWSGFGILPPATEADEPDAPGPAKAADAKGTGTRKPAARGKPSGTAGRAGSASAPGTTKSPESSRSPGASRSPGGARSAGGAKPTGTVRHIGNSGRTGATSRAEPADRARRAELAAAADREAAQRAAEERAAARRERYAEAERAAATAADAAAEAGADEDRLEAEVRDLEGRLTQARSDLAATRRRARRAEAAERRAQATLDRTPRG